MELQQKIEELLILNFNPLFLKVINESDQHQGHSNASLESHWTIILQSKVFQDLSRVQRHQKVYEVLGSFIPHPIHALRMKLFAPNEIKDLNFF
jgi:BolA protein